MSRLARSIEACLGKADFHLIFRVALLINGRRHQARAVGVGLFLNKCFVAKAIATWSKTTIIQNNFECYCSTTFRHMINNRVVKSCFLRCFSISLQWTSSSGTAYAQKEQRSVARRMSRVFNWAAPSLSDDIPPALLRSAWFSSLPQEESPCKRYIDIPN